MKITLFKGNKWINDKTIHITKAQNFQTIPTLFKTPNSTHQRYVVVNWLFFSFIIQRWMRTDYRIKTLCADFKLWFKEVILRQPIYYYWFTTKPNPKLPNAVLENWGYERATNRKEYRKAQQELYDNAEGETHIHRVNKHQYYKNFGKRGYTNV